MPTFARTFLAITIPLSVFVYGAIIGALVISDIWRFFGLLLIGLVVFKYTSNVALSLMNNLALVLLLFLGIIVGWAENRPASDALETLPILGITAALTLIISFTLMFDIMRPRTPILFQ